MAGSAGSKVLVALSLLTVTGKCLSISDFYTLSGCASVCEGGALLVQAFRQIWSTFRTLNTLQPLCHIHVERRFEIPIEEMSRGTLSEPLRVFHCC